MQNWCSSIQKYNCYGPFTNIGASANNWLNHDTLQNLKSVAGYGSSTPHWPGSAGQDWFVWYNHARFMKTPGVYIDVAANHPIWRSNTFFFDKCFKWSGICIEPSKLHFENLRQQRSCKVVPKCISNISNVLFVDNSGFRGGASRIVNNKKYKGLRGNLREQKCARLDEIFHHQNIKHIDFLSLDIEGHELNAISTINFNEVIIDIIISESDTIWPILQHKYIKHFVTNTDFIYIRKKLTLNIIKNGGEITNWYDIPACHNKTCATKSCWYGNIK